LLAADPSPASEQNQRKINENNLYFNIGSHGINVAPPPVYLFRGQLFNVSLSVGNQSL
jgi:hypothetical protein